MDGDFFVSAFVYLVAAVVSVPVAKRLGLGSVLGYLIAGALIGPHVLGLVGKDSKEVMHFAEFGVVMMLFLIGLELQPSRLWRLRGPILGLGGLQVLVTSLALAVAAMALGQELRVGLAVGLILALSSTAIVLQTLAEKHLLGTPGGQASFSVLLFQDIAVIPILALLPLLADPALAGHRGGEGHGSSLPGWLQGLLVMGAVAGIVVFGKFLLRPLLRFIASTRLREIFTAATLLLVVGIALVMQLVGVSPALGTFVAGVVLADSEYRHELETDIEPFKGLLLGLFFISVGASIDFALVSAEPRSIALLVAGVMLLKLAVLAVLALSFRLGRRDWLLFTFALAQSGEFAFVLFSFAKQEGVLTPAVTAPLTVVVALTMALTPLFMLFAERALSPLLAGPQEVGGDGGPKQHVEDEDNPVLIAGYGRFGQVVSRLLSSGGVGSTVLDHDPAHIDMLRRFGVKCFYGDATRIDLLRAAGAAKAKVLVIAVDDAEAARTLAVEARKHFPQLRILARAWDRPDAQQLLRLGVEGVSRETFGSALDLGVQALAALGYRKHQAVRLMRTFRHHDEVTLRALIDVAAEDERRYVTALHQRRADLERVIEADRKRLEGFLDEGWDGVPRGDEKELEASQAAE